MEWSGSCRIAAVGKSNELACKRIGRATSRMNGRLSVVALGSKTFAVG